MPHQAVDSENNSVSSERICPLVAVNTKVHVLSAVLPSQTKAQPKPAGGLSKDDALLSPCRTQRWARWSFWSDPPRGSRPPKGDRAVPPGSCVPHTFCYMELVAAFLSQSMRYTLFLKHGTFCLFSSPYRDQTSELAA